jgi:hypothetical protein
LETEFVLRLARYASSSAWVCVGPEVDDEDVFEELEEDDEEAVLDELTAEEEEALAEAEEEPDPEDDKEEAKDWLVQEAKAMAEKAKANGIYRFNEFFDIRTSF